MIAKLNKIFYNEDKTEILIPVNHKISFSMENISDDFSSVCVQYDGCDYRVPIKNLIALAPQTGEELAYLNCLADKYARYSKCICLTGIYRDFYDDFRDMLFFNDEIIFDTAFLSDIDIFERTVFRNIIADIIQENGGLYIENFVTGTDPWLGVTHFLKCGEKSDMTRGNYRNLTKLMNAIEKMHI